MAVVLIEGFDHTSAASVLLKGWATSFTAGGTTSIQSGRVSGQSYRRSGGGGGNSFGEVKQLPGAYSTIIVGVGIRQTSIQTVNTFRLRSSGTDLAILQYIDVGGGIYKYRILNGAGSVEWCRSTTTIVSNNWYYIEMKIVFSVTGSAEIRVNGISEGTFSGNTAAVTANQVSVNTTNTAATDFDDLYVCDTSGAYANDFLGDVRVQTLMPSANGTTQNWTPSAGSAFAAIDEGGSPNGDTDYISSGTPGDVSTFVMGDTSATTSDVYAVQVNHYVRKDDVAARQIATVIRHGGTDYVGATLAGLSTSYVHQSDLYIADPTASQWTKTSVDAIEVGVKTIT